MTVKPSFQGLIVLFVSSSSLCQLSYIPVFSICFVELNSIIAHFYLYLCARERIIEKNVLMVVVDDDMQKIPETMAADNLKKNEQ